ncbi:MAG TPA: 4Fe-4S binding protein [Dehalococcoidia bacterium]|nr:4Fe-4S binding protein [Dehalococcoidia bacterium]
MEDTKVEERVYRNLQKHLDSKTLGYPATKSGAEIRLLKHIFTPEEARLAIHLSYKPRTASQVHETASVMGLSFEDTEKMLVTMVKNGSIGRLEKEGTDYFYNLPLVVGMYEGQLHRLTQEFIEDINEYTATNAFGLSFLGSELPQMRTIPVGESITVKHNVTGYDHVTELINTTEGPIGIMECICRKNKSMTGGSCKQTSRLETCMTLGDWAKNFIMSGTAREISTHEALDIIRQNVAEGLVLQPSNSQKIEFICSCCGCCCGMLSVQKMLPKPVDFWATNYHSEVNSETCSSCGTCVDICQVGAISIDKSGDVASIDLNRCIGCGNCVINCPTEAINLIKNEKETVPPVNIESLFETNAVDKKGMLGKIKLITKLMRMKR